MHELSLADSLIDIATKHTPGGARLRRVNLRAGPRRMIDRDAMQVAWQAVLATRGLPTDVVLDLLLEPWTLQCQSCSHTYTSESHETPCPTCGLSGAVVGSNDLQITSITVDD
jgi:Zn finger protein HypA/HybF involved in hydrogenase expression